MNDSIEVTINGERRAIVAPPSLGELLADLSIDHRAVVVEHNGRIIKRERLAETAVGAGDTIEIVHFVGGG